MNSITNLSRRKREELFLATSHDIKLPEAMAEKDFWVCWLLDYLFHRSPWGNHLSFKGGTSLSKCYGLIERFSEDIDLILDWRILGYTPQEPWNERSKTSQDKLNKAIDSRTILFLRDVFLPQVYGAFKQVFSEPFELYIEDNEPQTVCFAYPRIFSDNAIVSVVRMEIGALAEWTPVQTSVVTPYAAECYPQVFKIPSTTVLTVMPERTFWEKVTILHKEFFRTSNRFPARYSRHYYDLHCMYKSPVKNRALTDLELLERVVLFKSRFYPTAAARYDLAQPGTMRLVPSGEDIAALNEDYEHMKNMIFGIKPDFTDILETLQQMESEINTL